MKQNFDELKTYIRGFLSGKGMHVALRAVNLGLEWHTGTRKDKITPEFLHQLSQIVHAMGVAGIGDLESLIAIIALHDIVEDKRYDLRWIRNEFGEIIANGVNVMSKKIYGIDAEKSNESYFYELSLDPNGSLAKGFDRTHNQSSMPGVFSIKKCLGTFAETDKTVLPMLKQARKNFPHQAPAYTLLRHRLKEQAHMSRTFLAQAGVDINDFDPDNFRDQ